MGNRWSYPWISTYPTTTSSTLPDGKLGMAILHMDNPKADAKGYIDEFDRQTDKITEETGKEPDGQAKYAENESEDTVYEHPAEICTGRYGLRYIWPTINDRTKIMIESTTGSLPTTSPNAPWRSSTRA